STRATRDEYCNPNIETSAGRGHGATRFSRRLTERSPQPGNGPRPGGSAIGDVLFGSRTTEQSGIFWCRRDCLKHMLEPPLRDLENVFWSTTCPNRHRSRYGFGHEFDVSRPITFMNQLAPNPFVENLLHGCTFTTIFDTNTNRVCLFQKPHKCIAVLDN